MKVPRALNLGCHHLFQALTRQQSNYAIVEAAGRVHDATQWQRAGCSENIFQLFPAGHVGEPHSPSRVSVRVTQSCAR
jgi:hypothetical protein